MHNDKFVNDCRRLGAACSQSQWLLLSKVFKKGSAAALASLSGAVICRVRYGREWSNWGLEEAGIGRGEA